MANITRELNAIQFGRWGYDIRMPIHDALMKLAEETPSLDPSQIPEYVYVVDRDGRFMVSSDDFYAVVKNESPVFIIDISNTYMVSSEGSYAIAKE